MTSVPVVAVGLALAATACGAARSSVSAATRAPAGPQVTAQGQTAGAPSRASATCGTTVVAAGDIVNDVAVADRTGKLAVAQHPARVLVLGDNQYETGSLAAYRDKYDRTAWGSLMPITRPVPGNHEYLTAGAGGYFTYFGHPAAYYAYDLGCGWRAYALNSEISLNSQVAWLRRDLTGHPGAPVLAYWHRPRWSSGTTHGSDAAMQPFWTALAGRRGAVLNGHEHNYERFAPIGTLREFVVGTGGTSTYGFGSPLKSSQRRIAHTPGVLRLTLQAGASYNWAFLNLSAAVLDSGRG